MIEHLTPEILDRFWEKVEKTDTCWLWKSSLLTTGYAQFHIKFDDRGKSINSRAHRLTYQLLVGPIPAGLELDHLCRVRHCVNPAHLDAVTRRENNLRSPISPAAINARKTHCPRGHEYAVHGRLTPRGSRDCRICVRDKCREAQRRYRAARQAAA